MKLPDALIIKRWVIAAPLIFLIHFLEEVPGFVVWANSYADQDISQGFFLSLNFLVLGVTASVTLIVWFSPSSLTVSVCLLWLSFIMLSNGCMHLVAAILEGGYVPGLLTAVLLYIPYCLALFVQFVRRKFVSPRTAIALSLLGAVPMFGQGFLILFLGSRLW